MPRDLRTSIAEIMQQKLAEAAPRARLARAEARPAAAVKEPVSLEPVTFEPIPEQTDDDRIGLAVRLLNQFFTEAAKRGYRSIHSRLTVVDGIGTFGQALGILGLAGAIEVDGRRKNEVLWNLEQRGFVRTCWRNGLVVSRVAARTASQPTTPKTAVTAEQVRAKLGL